MQTNNETGVPNFDNLASSILDLKTSIVGFTQGLSNTYYSSASTQEDLTNLRSNILDHSLTYSSLVVPVCKHVLSELHTSFDTMNNITSPSEFAECLDYLIETSTELETKVILCRRLHEETILSFEYDEKMAFQVLTNITSRNQAAKDELEVLERKKTDYEAKQKDGGSTIFEKLLAPFDYLVFIPIGSIAGKLLDLFANELERRKLAQLATKAAEGRSKTELLFLVETQIKEGILPSIKLFIENLTTVITILNMFKVELQNIQKRSKQGKDAANDNLLACFYKSVKASCDKIQKNSVHMQAYFDICGKELRAFKQFEGATQSYDLWMETNRLQPEPKDLSKRITQILFENKSFLSEELCRDLKF